MQSSISSYDSYDSYEGDEALTGSETPPPNLPESMDMEEGAAPNAYHVYRDNTSDDFAEAMSLTSEELNNMSHWGMPQAPSFGSRLVYKWRALPKRQKINLLAGVCAVLTLATILFSAGSGIPDDDQTDDIARVDGPSTVLHLSVSARTTEDLTATSAKLVHFSDTGSIQLEVETQKTITTLLNSVVHLSAPRPAALEGHLSLCVPAATVPGAEELVGLLSSVRGGLADGVRGLGRLVHNSSASVECAGELWHLWSHREDVLVCLRDDQLLEVNTAHINVVVLSQSQGNLGTPLPPPPCEDKEAIDTANVTKASMWGGYPSGVLAWFESEISATGDVTAPAWAPESEGEGAGEGEGEGDETPVVVKPAAGESSDHSISNSSSTGLKNCVFIHGVGNTPSPGVPALRTDAFPSYWGAVERHTPQCGRRVFLDVDTMYRGWDDRSLQEQVCAAATHDSDTGPVTMDQAGRMTMGNITNTIVFTHSMGNLMLAGAIEAGLCSLDQASSSWYEVSGPIKGAHIASVLDTVCNQTGLYKFAAAHLGYCTPEGDPAPAYKTLEPSYPGLDTMAQTIAPRLSGAMCGTSAFGLSSVYSVELSATSRLGDLQDDVNDGVVPWSSCNPKGSVRFEPDYQSAWYAAAVNHIDSACYEGDGLWGLDRKPCSWYALRK